MLAPWDWDNIKVLIWPWILMFAMIGRELRDETSGEISFGRRRGIQLATWMGISFAFFPGIEALLSSWSSPKDRSAVVWTLEDISSAEGALVSAPKSAIFAAATTPNHVLAFFGRPRVAGYEGHLWSHAIRSDRVLADLNVLMNGTEGWVEAAHRLKVTHIYWGPDERARFGSGPKPWQTQLTKVKKKAAIAHAPPNSRSKTKVASVAAIPYKNKCPAVWMPRLSQSAPYKSTPKG